ncbi:cell division protein ZapA [Shimia gijangensis]|uniref:Cell division protein ZapA n=1 Tax=Shimia gijangensis TaxID=1470563 RepID=A0A1M6EP45_9RHOB|nr:cell division protein ZapA [Shimia gijangensis]SHI87242.1 cell division protein ZapA [Shimia gijangensis]
MAEVEILIGGRAFEVACQEGEQHYLQAAAKMLDDEAQVLANQIGRIPENRMLLMAGLMLADKTAGVEDRLRELEGKLAETEAQLTALKNADPEQVKIAVIPTEVTDTLAELAARAEALAATVEEKAG